VRLWHQESPYGDVTVVVSDHGLREISLPGDDQPDGEAGKPDRSIARQLDDWFAGKRISRVARVRRVRRAAPCATTRCPS
jgi:hypothetical protein